MWLSSPLWGLGGRGKDTYCDASGKTIGKKFELTVRRDKSDAAILFIAVQADALMECDVLHFDGVVVGQVVSPFSGTSAKLHSIILCRF